jgi:hypothetical protein
MDTRSFNLTSSKEHTMIRRHRSSHAVWFVVLAAAFLVQPGDAYSQRRADGRSLRRHPTVLGNLPREHSRILVGGREYYYAGGVFYRSGPHGIVVTAAPLGARIKVLPVGYLSVRFGGVPLLLYSGTYYRYDPVGEEYVVVAPPAGPADTTSVSAPPLFDRMVLTSGEAMDGTYMGGTKSTLQFEVAGEVKEFPVDEIKSIVFAPPVK